MSDSPTTMVERTEPPRISADAERTAEGLFARSKTPGWDVWGNELSNDVELVPQNDQAQRPLADSDAGRKGKHE